MFDGVESLCYEVDRLQQLVDTLSPAVVFLSSRCPLPLRSIIAYVHLLGLCESDARFLIRSLLERWHFQYFEQPTRDDVAYIWEQAGGNPGSIERAVLQFQMERTHELAKFCVTA